MWHSPSPGFRPVRVRHLSPRHTAPGPRCPSETWIASSAGRTKILPSPMVPSGPVRATLMIVFIVRSRKSSLTTISRATLRSSVRRIFVPAVHFRPPPLPAKTLGVSDRQPRDFDFLQGVANGLELGRLNNGNHQFHAEVSLCRAVSRTKIPYNASDGQCRRPDDTGRTALLNRK